MTTPSAEEQAHGVLRKLKGAALNLALLLPAIAIAVGLCEIGVRIAAPQQLILKRPDFWRSVDVLGWAHHANVDTTMNTGEGEVRVLTDDDGFRVGLAGRVDASHQILIVGDSFMEALQVEYEDSVPGLLQARLPQQLGRPVSVRNSAVGGWDPNQYLMQTKLALERETYDIVVVMVYLGNDIIDRAQDSYPARAPVEEHPLRMPRSFDGPELIDALLYPLNDFLEVRSHLFILFKVRAQALLTRLGLSAAYMPRYFAKNDADSGAWNVTADVLRQIADVAREAGARPLIVLLPTDFQIDDSKFADYAAAFKIDPKEFDLDQPNELLAAALSARNLDFLDTQTALRAARARALQLYGSVDSHFTRDGHDVVATAILPVLAAGLQERLSNGEP